MKPAFALQTKKQQPGCDYVSVTPVRTQSLRCQLQPLIHYKQKYCGQVLAHAGSVQHCSSLERFFKY